MRLTEDGAEVVRWRCRLASGKVSDEDADEGGKTPWERAVSSQRSGSRTAAASGTQTDAKRESPPSCKVASGSGAECD